MVAHSPPPGPSAVPPGVGTPRDADPPLATVVPSDEAVAPPGPVTAAPVTAEAATRRRWTARFGSPPRRPLLQGLVGGVLMLIGGLGSGGVLITDPLLSDGPLGFWRYGHGHDLANALVYVGLGLQAWAWIMLGREVLANRVGGRAVLSTAVVWLIPMLVTPPLFTRDPYSYLAQGALPLAGFDPYAVGPEALTGPLADNVHFFWTSTPAPYGPVFIMLAKGIAALAGENMILGVILIRLAVLPGLVLLVAALPGLVKHLGGRIPVAMWLTVASPMFVVHLVGGVHNDLLVVGLVAAGSLLVLEKRPVAGIAVVTLAMAVKATAGLVLPFLVLVWAARLTGPRWKRIGKAAAAGVGVSVSVFAACSLIAGVGLGWLPALYAPSMIVNWLSWPTGVGLVVHWLVSLVADVSYTGFIAVTRALGAIVLVVFAWRQWLASRDGQPDALRRAGLVLLAAAVLAPATLPWYFSWCLALLAMVRWTPRALAAAAFASIFLIMVAYPSGELAMYNWGYLALAAGARCSPRSSLLRPDPLGLRGTPARAYALHAPRV